MPAANGAAPSPLLPPIDFHYDKYPFCIVWTPIPVLSWFFPIIGHMGIALASGVIHDFAGPYYVSEDNMAFGRPARYLRLDPGRVDISGVSVDGADADGVITTATIWDECVTRASVVYGTRQHNLCCDNCHSHVAMALGLMQYDRVSAARWNMVRLAVWMFACGRYVGWWGAVRTWLPFALIVLLCCLGGLYL